MAITHQVSLGVSGNGTQTARGANVSGSLEPAISKLVAASSTNALIPLAFTRASMKSLFISVDAALTLKTNSSSSPADTFSLSPLAPFIWQLNSGIPQPFSADVTALYVTSGSTAVNLVIRLLQS